MSLSEYTKLNKAILDNKKELNTVVTVIQAGYLVRDRLLRPAMVIVTKK